MPAVNQLQEGSESSSEDEEDHACVSWSGLSKTIPIFLFFPEAIVSKDGSTCCVGEHYNMSFKIVRTESRLVRGLLTNHGFSEVHPDSNNFNLLWTGSHLKPYILRSLKDFQKVNHFPRSYELTRKDRLYKNIQRMQQAHGFKNFHIVPQTFLLPDEYQEFCNCFTKDKGPWIIKPVASSRGRGIYLVSSPSQISMDENILVSRYISNPLLIDEFKFDMRLYVLVTSYDPLLIYVYEEGLARFATVKYDRTSKNMKNTFMHLTNYSLNKKSSDYVSCDDPDVEDYGNKWSMSAVLRYLKQEGKDTKLLMQQVEDVIIKAVLSAELEIASACKMFVPHKTNCFELYGFDVLIDTNLKPWLLEVNLSPSLACDAPLDLKIKASMIADMLSLVGFVCQDPLLRQSHSDRVTLDPSLKQQQQQQLKNQQLRSLSISKSETQGLKDQFGAKQGQGQSNLTLTSEEIKVLRRIKEEHERRGGFIRIFPTANTWALYGGYLESKTSMNYILANRLFHGRNVSQNVQLQVDPVDGYHTVQYERKLLSLEARKRRRCHFSHRSAARTKKLGKESKASPTESRGLEGEECIQEERQEMKYVLRPVSHKVLVAEQRKRAAAALEGSHNEALSSSEGATHNGRPRVNLLRILQQGWDISKMQARMAFSSYLQRVQHRLLAESRANTIPAWPDKDNDQMELVIRFLKRAASNLQQDLKVVLPSSKLPLPDRRRILSQQLGEFIRCYNKETQHMVKKLENSREENCIDASVFHEYIAVASESDLEEVLTFYTQKNKSASVFLGTKVGSVKKDTQGKKALEEPGNILSVAKEDFTTPESTFSTGKVSSDPDIKTTESHPSVCTLSEEQQAAIRNAKTNPDIQASQHCTGFPVTLDFTQINQQRSFLTQSSLPLCCPPPPPLPQPPSYTQSLAKSQFYQSESLSNASHYASSLGITQPLKVVWTDVSTCSKTVSKKQPTPVLRRTPSFTSYASSFGTASSTPGLAQIYSHRVPRPTSASQVIRKGSSSKLDSKSAGTLKELNSLSVQAQSNQQAFISALQKLADKQIACNHASSSHINFLTQHLTNLNLTNGVVSRESVKWSPEVQPNAEPLKADHSGTDHLTNTGLRTLTEDECPCDGQIQTACRQVTGMSPQQHQQATQGCYQLQFAIQQLQQQRVNSQPFLGQRSQRQQAQDVDEARTPLAKVPTNSSSFDARPGHSHNHSQACVSLGFSPKPPSSAREGQIRKSSTKRLIKQTSAERSANGTMSSGQHTVYEAICGKTGPSVYHKLSQDPEPSHR